MDDQLDGVAQVNDGEIKVDAEAADNEVKSADNEPTAEELRRAFEKGEYPYATKLSRRSYEKQKAALQAELLKVQLWAQETGQKFVMLFEGRDAAGKGGTIKRFREGRHDQAVYGALEFPIRACGGVEQTDR